ncbi:MAG TPA: hypothetical protein VGY66_13465 [Gemmataceae bacterium]|jgi:hypothetical protein|nr:hypothetical protein [Gemmataceae bacterium]
MITADVVDRILTQLDQIRARCPELRFGQLIAIIGELAQDETGHSLWDVEDADFAVALERFAEDMVRRGSGQAKPAATPNRGGTGPSPDSTLGQPPRQVS